ncbi:MAG: 3-phosphoshikimate 1-carboxyvinyltransferase [Thermoplasmata archaeon]
MIIKPVNSVSGELKVPSSKSYTHRVLFLGLLCDGITTFEDPLVCDDTRSTLEAVRSLGAEGDWTRVESDGDVKGGEVFAGESGTTARIAIAIASLAEGRCTIDGAKGLRKRPMKPLLNSLSQLDVEIHSRSGKLPVEIEGPPSGKEVQIIGQVSSQFITAMMYVGSQIGLDIRVTDGLVSEPYVDMTVEVLRKSGINIESYEGLYQVDGNIEPTHFSIPGDYSSAAFFLAAGALFGRMKLINLNEDSVQADSKIIDIIEKFGAQVSRKDDTVRVVKNGLQGIECNCDDFPDLFPILTVLGVYAEGETQLTGKQLRYKESDRISNMFKNLKKMGADIEELEDGVIVRKSELKGAELDPRGDHRIAMALTVAALGADGNSKMRQSDCVSKSYPNFYQDLKEVIDYER